MTSRPVKLSDQDASHTHIWVLNSAARRTHFHGFVAHRMPAALSVPRPRRTGSKPFLLVTNVLE